MTAKAHVTFGGAIKFRIGSIGIAAVTTPANDIGFRACPDEENNNTNSTGGGTTTTTASSPPPTNAGTDGHHTSDCYDEYNFNYGYNGYWWSETQYAGTNCTEASPTPPPPVTNNGFQAYENVDAVSSVVAPNKRALRLVAVDSVPASLGITVLRRGNESDGDAILVNLRTASAPELARVLGSVHQLLNGRRTGDIGLTRQGKKNERMLTHADETSAGEMLSALRAAPVAPVKGFGTVKTVAITIR